MFLDPWLPFVSAKGLISWLFLLQIYGKYTEILDLGVRIIARFHSQIFILAMNWVDVSLMNLFEENDDEDVTNLEFLSKPQMKINTFWFLSFCTYSNKVLTAKGKLWSYFTSNFKFHEKQAPQLNSQIKTNSTSTSQSSSSSMNFYEQLWTHTKIPNKKRNGENSTLKMRWLQSFKIHVK